MRRSLAAGVMLATLMFGGSALGVPRPDVFNRPGCPFLVTVKHDERAADVIYAGTRPVTLHDRRRLGYFERCERNPQAQAFVRGYNRARGQQHDVRVQDAAHPLEHAVASWYYDAGNTACGFHAGMGVANRTLACGTRVTFYYGGRSAGAVVDDRGPFVAGRDWDFNQNVRAALGFSGYHLVGYRLG